MIVLRILFKIFAFGFWVLLVLLLLILFLPFVYELYALNNEEKQLVKLDAYWLFGLLAVGGSYEKGQGFMVLIRILGIPIRIREDDLMKMAGKKTKKDKSGQKEKKKEGKKKKESTRKKLVTREGIQLLVESAGNALKHILPRRISGYGIVGFEDPYYTGLLAAWVETLRGLGVHRMNLQYVFDREVYEGELSIEGRITMVYFVYMALRLLIVKPSRELLLGVKKP